MGLRQSCWNCRLLEGGENRSSRSDRDVERLFAGGEEWISARAAVLLEGKWISDRDAGTGGEVDLRQRSWSWNWYLLEEELISA